MSQYDPWVLKYSPKSVNEMVLTEKLKNIFNDIIDSGKLSNMSLFGSPGIGKSTLSKIIAETLDCEYWFQPCSSDGSIEMIKTTVKNFCSIITSKKYKIIILDEADQLSNQAQLALRNIIVDEMPTCRFILTANYQDKIISALKSRCTPILLEFSNQDILKHCLKILKNENIKFNNKSAVDFYNEVIIKKYPDIRAIIEHLQMMSLSGELNVVKVEKNGEVNEIANYIFNNIKSDIKTLREFIISNEDKFSCDYIKLAQDLFDLFEDNASVMSIIADALWRMSFQLDKEIQFTGMLINIKEILK